MKNAMTYKGYVARVEFDPEDRIFFGLSLIHISEPTRPY